MKETARAFDAFQCALVDYKDLRNAAGNYYILCLRKSAPKLVGRQVADHARALANYSKACVSLLPRFPRFSTMLEPFASLAAFNREFPAGIDEDGMPVDRSKEYPIHACESLDMLVQELLLPTLLGKNMVH